MRTFRLLSWPLLASFAAAQVVAVSPSDRSTLEGSSFTHFPLGRANARMQTLHRDLPGGTLLSGHAYRRDAITVRGQVDGFASDLQVTLSLSPNLPTQASTTFANNVGSNPVVVLPRTIVTFPATQRPALDPAPTFELAIPYQLPFLVPGSGGTVCVDVEVFGNSTATSTNTNLSVFLDAHEHWSDGRSEQAGFRTLQGCAAPGETDPSYATGSLWRLSSGARFDVSIRDGVPDNGSGTTRGFLMLGTSVAGTPWPTRPDCPFWSSAELWFALPGSGSSAGSYDSSLVGLPTLPPGYRLWCQAGSIDLTSASLAFTDALTLVTPGPGTLPIPAARIVNSTSQAASTGTVSYVVPVMAFF
jgi:hypothetical protein